MSTQDYDDDKRASTARQRILEKAKDTDFENPKAESLKQFEFEFQQFQVEFEDHASQVYESFIHYLARPLPQEFYETAGYPLLKWLLANQPHLFEQKVGTVEPMLPFHVAIENGNTDFLDCLLDIAKDRRLDIASILADADSDGRNCLHMAIHRDLPCSASMVEICQGDALMQKEAKKEDTPLHLAMRKASTGHKPMLRLPKSNERHNPSNISRVRTADHSAPIVKFSGYSDQITSRRDNQARLFDPHAIYEAMKSKTQIMSIDDKSKFMTNLLTAINHDGRSPYQLRLQRYKVSKNSLSPEAIFQKCLKDDIFAYLKGVDNVQKALYGTEGEFHRTPEMGIKLTIMNMFVGPEKELFLDMSDFNYPSHDFRGFIKDLTDDIQNLKEGVEQNPKDEQKPKVEKKLKSEQKPKDEQQQRDVRQPKDSQTQLDISLDMSLIDFEEILFYVRLPDFNNFKDPPHTEIRTLFSWLKLRGVKIIRSLSIPDSTTSPMSDVLVEGAIIKKFIIEKFEWRKLDINLNILIGSGYADKITGITLYSSGNWSALYHWISDEGLPKLTGLLKVKIIIVQLSPGNDEEARTSHATQSEDYAAKVRGRLLKMQGKKPEFEFEVKTNEKWNFPVSRYEDKNEPVLPNLKLVEQQVQCHDFLRKLKRAEPPYKSENEKNYCQRLKDLTSDRGPDKPDLRIKVAVIDNGADRIRTSVRKMIARGSSFVTGGSDNDDRTLPWWMVADPHGTQMASLIAKANPFCRLYIARVGKGRKDILPENAAKAIDWAIEQKVDIISISWVMKKDQANLKDAIAKAINKDRLGGRRPILVFCSTADEGVYSGPVYPACYPGTVTVAATDKYGHLQPESADGVNILVPGENIPADGPSYMDKDSSIGISGSSVATASAAGIASLALLLLKTFNWNKSKAKEPEELSRFYTKEGILAVFDKMNAHVSGIQLSELFPDNNSELPSAWKYTKFPPRTEERSRSN